MLVARSCILLLVFILVACATPAALNGPSSVGEGKSEQGASQARNGPDLCRVARERKEPRLTEVCGGIKHLGLGTFTELGVVPQGVDILKAVNSGAAGRDELTAQRHFFSFDVFVVTVGKDSGDRGLDLVLRTAAALDVLKRFHPAAYQFITSTMTYPTPPSLSDTQWKNRNDKIVISFDKTPDAIAASGTVLGPVVTSKQVGLYSNYAIVSIDVESILGELENIGSRRIYKRPSAEDNYRTYMADGLLFSLVHEMAHQYIFHRNSTSRLANDIYRARNSNGADAEEIVANETAMALIGPALSPEQRQFVMDENTDLVAKPGVREWLGQWLTRSSTSRTQLIVPE